MHLGLTGIPKLWLSQYQRGSVLEHDGVFSRLVDIAAVCFTCSIVELKCVTHIFWRQMVCDAMYNGLYGMI